SDGSQNPQPEDHRLNARKPCRPERRDPENGSEESKLTNEESPQRLHTLAFHVGLEEELALVDGVVPTHFDRCSQHPSCRTLAVYFSPVKSGLHMTDLQAASSHSLRSCNQQ